MAEGRGLKRRGGGSGGEGGSMSMCRGKREGMGVSMAAPTCPQNTQAVKRSVRTSARASLLGTAPWHRPSLVLLPARRWQRSISIIISIISFITSIVAVTAVSNSLSRLI